MYFLLYSFIFPLCFTVLLEHLRRLYGYSSIFKCCQCIITATAPATLAVATLAALTPDYEVLTNQGDAPVSVYIDSIALQLNLSHHSNEHRILYILRALNTTPLCHLSDTNNTFHHHTLPNHHSCPPATKPSRRGSIPHDNHIRVAIRRYPRLDIYPSIPRPLRTDRRNHNFKQYPLPHHPPLPPPSP
jgi:hypothetical protein